jgi:hypothetical protein
MLETHLGVPCDSGRMELHDVLLELLESGDERLDPLALGLVAARSTKLCSGQRNSSQVRETPQ